MLAIATALRRWFGLDSRGRSLDKLDWEGCTAALGLDL